MGWLRFSGVVDRELLNPSSERQFHGTVTCYWAQRYVVGIPTFAVSPLPGPRKMRERVRPHNQPVQSDPRGDIPDYVRGHHEHKMIELSLTKADGFIFSSVTAGPGTCIPRTS